MTDIRRTHKLRQNAHRLDAGLKTALKRGGLVIIQRAQELAPELSGRMTRAISVSEPRMDGGKLTVRIGPSGVEYAKYTELPRYIAGKHLGARSEAKGATMPWLRPAAREKKGEAMDIIRASIRSTLQAIARTG